VKDLIKVRLLGRSFVERFIAVGDAAYVNARARGFPNDKLILVHNGIDVQRFQPNDVARRRVRESLGVTENQLVYLLLGWDPYRKGVDLFIRAATEVAPLLKEPNLFLIIGERPTRNFVRNLPESLRLGSALRIIDPIEDFPSFVNAVDIVVSASRREGFSFALAEGMAAGKLILSSDIPGAQKTFGGSPGVWFFPTEDWIAQANGMKKARELSLIERQRLGEANTRYVAEHYSLQGWAQRIGDVYEGLFKQRMMVGRNARGS
jgi:glycosyltransferase involved in cell wall biosynthesis